MRSGIKLWWVAAAVALLAIAYGAWAAIQAHRDLVTLNVRNMDVRKVISKIEWQTRETIVADKNVQGKITLNVTRAPLEHVLHIIGDQTSSRWSVMYPLYSSAKSFHALERVLRGESDPELVGWTNLQSRGFGGFGGRGGGGGPGFGGPGGPGFGGGGFGPGGGMFADFRTNLNHPISLDIQNKDVRFATIALSRFSAARVVPDDYVNKNISLKLDQVSARDAVARLAKAAGADWDKVYSLRGDDGPRDFANRRDQPRRELSDEEREEMRRQRAAMEEELKQALSAEERARLEQARADREKFFQEMQSMSPDQRRDRFQQMREQRNLDRIKNTTPEQRLERYREMAQRRQRFQDRQNRGDRQGRPGQPAQPPPPGPRP